MESSNIRRSIAEASEVVQGCQRGLPSTRTGPPGGAAVPIDARVGEGGRLTEHVREGHAGTFLTGWRSPGATAPGERRAGQPIRTDPAFDVRAVRLALPRKRAETVIFPFFGSVFGFFLIVSLAV